MSKNGVPKARLVDTEPNVAARELQICCIGLPRTGTVSLHNALEILGFRTYHGLEFVANGKRDMNLLIEALTLKEQYSGRHQNGFTNDSRPRPYSRKDFDKIWSSYDAIIDLPGFAFVDELLREYPNAKFILTERKEEAWLSSMEKTVFQHLRSWPLYLQSIFDGEHAGPMRSLLGKWLNYFSGGLKGRDYQDRAIQAYRKHNAHCKSAIPREKLLVVNLDAEEKLGWEALCSFLGKQVPDCDWPHANNSAAYAEKSSAMRHQGFWRPAQHVLLVTLLMVALGGAAYKRST